MSARTIQSIGQVLLHFFWQGALLCLVLSIAISSPAACAHMQM